MFTGPIYICLYNFVKTETLSLNSVGDKSTFVGDDEISWIISTCKKCNKLKANNWYNFELTNYHLQLIQPNCRTANKPLFIFTRKLISLWRLWKVLPKCYEKNSDETFGRILNLSLGKLFFIIRPDEKVCESFEWDMVLISTIKIFQRQQNHTTP